MRRPYLYLDGDDLRAVTDLPMPFLKQIYGHRFITPYRRYDDGMTTVSVGRGWGRSVPAWFAEVRLAAFLTELIYPRIVRLVYPRIDRQGYDAGKVLNPYYPPWLLLEPDRWPQPFNDYRRHFAAILKAVGCQSTERTLLVLFPMRSQVIDAERKLAIAKLGGYGSSVRIDALNSVVREMAEESGIAVIDVLNAFGAHPDPEALFQKDNHLSAMGMLLIVKQVIAALSADTAKTGLPPPDNRCD